MSDAAGRMASVGVGRRLLVVDDDEAFRGRLCRAFAARGYLVGAVGSAREALQLAQRQPPELAVVDLRMPGEWGLHLVRSLAEVGSETTVVVLTAFGSIATALEAVRLGAANFLQKPASVEEIESALLWPGEPAACERAPQDVPSLARAEWEHINRVLTECDGNIRKAATLLGLHRRTLQRKLAKYPSSR